MDPDSRSVQSRYDAWRIEKYFRPLIEHLAMLPPVSRHLAVFKKLTPSQAVHVHSPLTFDIAHPSVNFSVLESG